jgi:hypothetical protein
MKIKSFLGSYPFLVRSSLFFEGPVFFYEGPVFFNEDPVLFKRI